MTPKQARNREDGWTELIVTMARSEHNGEKKQAMYTIYQLDAGELDEAFLEALRTLFHGKRIEITVAELDETEYLLRSEANRERLLAAINNVENGRDLVETSL